MIKLLLTVLTAMMLFIFPSLKMKENVTVDQDFPAKVVPASGFTVHLTIHKGSLKGFARLQQYLPAGFTAEEVNSNGGDFIFDEQGVKFIWTQLPATDDFTISYRIKSPSTVTGRQVVNGVFIYIDDDKTQRQPLDPAEFIVENEKNVASAENTFQPEVKRKLISIDPEKGEYKAELTIRPNNINESAQFTDEIPAGFSAELISSNGAEFKFENQKAIFTWKKLPVDSLFIISYSVKSGKPGASPIINGIFVYGDSAMDAEPVATNDQTVQPEKTLEQENETASENITPPLAPVSENTSAARAVASTQLSGESGIHYKVQISATRTSSVKTGEWFSTRYHLNENVELTMQDGWKKYLVGNFSEYKSATELRKKTQANISDAFVVAYQNGSRIPVSEALKNNSINQ